MYLFHVGNGHASDVHPSVCPVSIGKVEAVTQEQHMTLVIIVSSNNVNKLLEAIFKA